MIAEGHHALLDKAAEDGYNAVLGVQLNVQRAPREYCGNSCVKLATLYVSCVGTPCIVVKTKPPVVPVVVGALLN